MRNLKKVLTLVLTLAMLLSVMVVGAGAATFGDQDSITNKEAVDVCTTLNIIGGYEDGTFRPAGNVTRAEMSKMICVALNGGKEPTMGSGLIATFNDVATSDWSAPYIEYCVSQGIVGGVGGGRFNPTGNITGTQAAKMLLCILGYNASIQGYVGDDYWETNINVDAAQKHLYDGLESIDASAPLTRDQAAQMIWNALQAYEVEYVTTLVTGPNGELTSKVTVQDRYDSTLKSKITLLSDKYEAAIDTGRLTAVPSAKKNAKGVTFKPNNAAAVTFKNVTTDYSSLLGYEVKVIYNTKKVDEAGAIYGVYATTDNETYEAVWKDIEKDGAKVKFDGKSYTLDGAITVYADGSTYTNWTSANFDKAALADTVLFIDNDGDSKIEAAQVKTQNVVKVTYVSGTAMDTGSLIAANKGYTPFNPYDADVDLDDVIVYDGIAKDDYAKVSYNLYNDKVVYEKIDVKEAKVEATRTTGNNTKEIRIDGTWYKPAVGYTTMPSIVSGDTVEYVAIGTLLYNVKKTDGTWGSKNLAVVYDVVAYGVGSKADDLEVSFITRDGTKKSLILDKYNNYEVTYSTNYKYGPGGGDVWADDDAAKTALAGKLMTYREDGGEVSLMPVSSSQNAGYDKVHTLSTSSDTTYNNSVPNLGGKNIADNAVIFLTTGSDAKVVSGKELKTASGTVTYTLKQNSIALGGTENGVEYVQAATLGVNTMPTITGTNYAYVLNAAETTDDQDYRYIELWTANGKLEAYEASSDLYTYDGGEIVTYTVVSTSDGRTVIKNVEEVATGTTNGTLQMGAITSDGFYGSSESAIAINGKAYDLTSDAIVLNVDTDQKEGINSDNPKSGAREARQGENNILYVTNGDGDIVFALIDSNNNKVLCADISLGSSAGVGNINAALGSADEVTVTGGALSSTSGLIVPKGKTLTVPSGITGTDPITGGGVLNVGTATKIPESTVVTPVSITADASGKGEVTLDISDSVALKAGAVTINTSDWSDIAYELNKPKHAGSTIARVVKVTLPAANKTTNVTLTCNSSAYNASGTIVDTAGGDLYMTIGNAINWVKLAYTGTDTKDYELTVNFTW